VTVIICISLIPLSPQIHGLSPKKGEGSIWATIPPPLTPVKASDGREEEAKDDQLPI